MRRMRPAPTLAGSTDAARASARIVAAVLMGILTIHLDDELDRDLAKLAKRQKRTRSELVRDILRRDTTVELFDEALRRLRPYAERAGYLTDEDFFRDSS